MQSTFLYSGTSAVQSKQASRQILKPLIPGWYLIFSDILNTSEGSGIYCKSQISTLCHGTNFRVCEDIKHCCSIMPTSPEHFICNSRLLVHDVHLRVCIHEFMNVHFNIVSSFSHMHIRTYIVLHMPPYRLEIDQTSAVPPERCSKCIIAWHEESYLLIKHAMFLQDGETIWKMHKSNLTCLAIFVLYVFVFVCCSQKPWSCLEWRWDLFFLFHVSHCFPKKSPLSFIETLSLSSPLI